MPWLRRTVTRDPVDGPYAPTCYPNTEETDVKAAFHARLGAVFYREGAMPPAVIPSGREDGAEAPPTPSATGTPAP